MILGLGSPYAPYNTSSTRIKAPIKHFACATKAQWWMNLWRTRMLLQSRQKVSAKDKWQCGSGYREGRQWSTFMQGQCSSRDGVKPASSIPCPN